MMRRMRIIFGITVRMVHAVQNRVSTGAQVRGSLKNPSEYVERLFPERAHGKHFMRRVPVQKEGLEKQ